MTVWQAINAACHESRLYRESSLAQPSCRRVCAAAARGFVLWERRESAVAQPAGQGPEARRSLSQGPRSLSSGLAWYLPVYLRLTMRP